MFVRIMCVVVLAFLLVSGMLYGLCGFIAMDFNVLQWNGIGRFCLVALCICVAGPVSVGCGCAMHDEIEKAEKERKLRERLGK